MFITDTVDAAYPPESWSPQATMDRLGEILNQRQDLSLLRDGDNGPRGSISNMNINNRMPLHPSTAMVASMTQRASFSGTTLPGNGPGSDESAAAADYANEALKQAGLPSHTTLLKPAIKPLLSNIRQSKITHLKELEPFFSRASLANYEGVYSLGIVDWNMVEKSLEADLFEGGEEC
jgi:hypothetical protein